MEHLQTCLQNVLDTTYILKEIGFVINPEKSTLTPTQATIFLGFTFSTKSMILTLTNEKENQH